MTTSIWVLMQGENCEGGSISSIHKSRKNAIKAALNTQAVLGKWKPDHEDDSMGTMSWSSGCDWMRVKRYEVSP